MKPNDNVQLNNGLMDWQLRDVKNAIIAAIGVPAYNAWAPAIDPSEFPAAAEKKLLDLMGRQTREQDFMHYFRLVNHYEEA